MAIWLIFALGSAAMTSLLQVVSKEAILDQKYSKVGIKFVSVLISSAILFVVSYFFIGLPDIDPRFWPAVLITGILNIVSAIVFLRAYEVGEFSSVYSMSLVTPIFLLGTSFIFLGEAPSLLGVIGVILTIIGLWFAFRHRSASPLVPSFSKGNLLGLSVALISSVSVNFDKAAALYSDRFFAPASSLAVMAIGYGIYLAISPKKIFANGSGASASTMPRVLTGLNILLILGLMGAAGTVLYNSALLAGFASYTIAVKRVGVLLGVIWGWLFFKEKEVGKKLFGAAIAIGGVVLILFS